MVRNGHVFCINLNFQDNLCLTVINNILKYFHKMLDCINISELKAATSTTISNSKEVKSETKSSDYKKKVFGFVSC